MRQIRILQLPSEYAHPCRPLDGIFCRNQAQALRKAGFRVDMAFVEPRSLRTLSLQKLKESHFQYTVGDEGGIFTVRQKAWNPILNSVPGGVTWAWQLRRLCSWYIHKFGRPDIIHAHNTLWAGYAGSLVAKQYHIPLIITEHSSNFIRRRIPLAAVPYATQALAAADTAVAVSRSLADSVIEYVGGIQFSVLPNIIDTNFFSLGLPRPGDGKFVFLAVASLDSNKAMDILIRAFASRFSDRCEVELRIVGIGPERQALESLAAQSGVTSRVLFCGQLPPESVRKQMWNSDCLVLCSYHETFGMVLAESLSSGRPVIATRCGGPDEIVTEDVGLLVTTGDWNGLGDAMERMANGLHFEPQALRDYAVSHFGEDMLVAKLHTIYESALCKQRHHAGAGVRVL
jgi:glycosyltransferase involved in cell wall biosynthesis